LWRNRAPGCLGYVRTTAALRQERVFFTIDDVPSTSFSREPSRKITATPAINFDHAPTAEHENLLSIRVVI